MRLTPRPIRRGGRGRGGRESSRSPGADSFLLVVDVPVIMPQIQFIHRRLVFLLWRRDKYPQYMLYSSRCSSWTRFLILPVVVLRQVFGSMVQKTVVFPQLQFITVVDTPFVAQMLISSCVWTGRLMHLLCRSCSSGLLLQPLVFGSHLYVIRCSQLEYKIVEFSAIRQWTDGWRQSTRPFRRISHGFYVKTFLSWCSCRFPRFVYHRDSHVAVH